MATIPFPSSPTLNQQFSYLGRTWLWNGLAWQALGTAQGNQGTQGPLGYGLQGYSGVQGFQGLLGIQGLQGTQGLQGPNAALSFGTTPPSNPNIGDRWTDSNSGITYTWIFDGILYNWVEVAGTGYAGAQGTQGIIGAGTQGPVGPGAYTVSATMPISPRVGDSWLNTNDGRSYTWDGYEWFESTGAVGGLQGLQGANGAQGVQGINGPFGVQGYTGPQGVQGLAGTGIQGLQGIQGPAPASGLTFTNSTFAGTTSIAQMLETTNVNATVLNGAFNYDVLSNAGIYYTTGNPTANWSINLRGNAGTLFASVAAVGQSFTFTMLVQQGATAYYNSGFNIDGVSVTPKWAGTVAPASGTPSGLDVYTYTVTKTGTSTYSVIAALTRYA